MLTLIAAIAANNAIGKDGQLVWHNKEDMAHFKQLTLGKTVLMGRKTWESIPEKFRPLPGRTNAIISRQQAYVLPEGVLRFGSVDDALNSLRSADVVVIGGAEIYRQTIDRADRLEITQVNLDLEADTYFPPIEEAIWQEIAREEHGDFSFVTYQRQKSDSLV